MRSTILAATLVFAVPALAQPIPVGDPGFEDTIIGSCSFIQGFRLPSPWTMRNNTAGGAWEPGNCWDIIPFEGTNVAYSNNGTIQQTLSTNAVPGAGYTLSVAVGRRTNPCCPFRPTVLALEAGTGQSPIIILRREILLAEAPAPGTWSRYRVTGTLPAGAPSGLPLVITLKCDGAQVNFDAVTLERGNGCPADFNGDGFLDFFDYDDFVNCFENNVCAPGSSADFNQDGFVDFFDYDDFVAAFESGAC